MAVIQPRPAVATVDAGAPGLSFTLVNGVCAEKSCPAVIELVASGQRLDAVPLEFAANEAALAAKVDDASFATHELIASYTAGQEEGAVTTALQAVRLSPQRTALLVQQAAGFEHVKRRRDVFIVEDKKLKRIWSQQDGAGPVRSYADVLARGDAQEIVVIEGGSFVPTETDRVTAQRLVWDDAAKTLSAVAVDTMSAVAVGSFASAEAARAKLADACLANYWILSDDQLGGKSRRFVLALLTPDAAAATSLKSNRECSPKDARRVAQFRPIPEKK